MFKSFNTPAMQYRRAQAGITLIEVSIGLIIAAIIAAAAFIAFQNNSRRQEVRENISAITEISSEARNKFVKTGQQNLLTTAAAVAANLLEPIGGSNNTYGGAVTFIAGQPATTGTGATPAQPASLVWSGVPAEQCVDLVLATRANFSSVLVGTTEAVGATVAAIDTACVDNVALTFDL